MLMLYLIFKATAAFLMAVFVLGLLSIAALVWLTVEVARMIAEWRGDQRRA
jgi:hypothetical protein